MRTTSEIIHDHLRRRRERQLDRDLHDNFADEVVLLSDEGVHHDQVGVHKLASILDSYVSSSDYRYDDLVVEGAYALLRWSATGDDVVIHDGANSFVTRNDRIIVQTIHYAVAPRNPLSRAGANRLFNTPPPRRLDAHR